MNKHDKMVLREIAREYEVKQNQITFLEGYHSGDKLTKIVFRIRYNKFETIVYSCCPYFAWDTAENKLTVTLYENTRVKNYN